MKTMKKTWSLHQPHIKAKIIGVSLLFTGAALLYYQTSLSIKLGLGCILIGLFSIVIISEKTIPETISNTQIQGPLQAIQKIISQLNLKGNAIFLPQNSIQNQQKIYIPVQNNDASALPDIDDELVFFTGSNNTSLGISLPPSGSLLLEELEKETTFTNTAFDELEAKLQLFVGKDLFQSIALKKINTTIQIKINKPLNCPSNPSFCTQYPCPPCSAALSAICKATQQKLRIDSVQQKGKKTIFHLSMQE
jgi:hypothetical protein